MAEIEQLTVPTTPLKRSATANASLPQTASSFVLDNSHKSYKHQFANLYFARLNLLKGIVKGEAEARWRGLKDSPPLVPRVLEVVKAQLCYIIGTVYMEMPLKPNVLEDLTRDRSLPAPPTLAKYHSPDDVIMLEDESGRVQLAGNLLQRTINTNGDGIPSTGGWENLLVTGVIMAALGHETASGEFEVMDYCFAGMAPMMVKSINAPEDNMDIDDTDDQDEWVAILSGLQIDEESSSDIRLELLSEYLSGEAGADDDQIQSSRITRLIIAGNSLAPVLATSEKPGLAPEVSLKAKRFGLEASNFSAVPTSILGGFLSDVVRAVPTHLLAGATDPSGVLLPQQPLPRAMFREASQSNNFRCETNPIWLGTESGSSIGRKRKRSVFVHSGQSLEDMYKYVPSPPTTRLDLACASLHWRHSAPTAPDTLWCYPYFTQDPFALQGTPDLYVMGCQPEFATRLVSSNDFDDTLQEEERRCRVVVVPGFKETGTLVLVNLRNLEVKTIEFGSRQDKNTGSNSGNGHS